MPVTRDPVKMCVLVPVISPQDVGNYIKTIQYLRGQELYPTHGCIVTDRGDVRESPLWQIIPPHYGRIYEFERPISSMVRQGVPRTDVSDVFVLAAPGAVPPPDFVKEAHGAMVRDPGLAIYAHAFGQKASMGAAGIRSALREGRDVVPQVLMARRSILEQVDMLKGDDFATVFRGMLAEACRYFRCHLVTSEDGMDLAGQGERADVSDMPESTPFEELMADCCEYFEVTAGDLARIARRGNVDENAAMFRRQMDGIDPDSGTDEAKRAIGAYYEGNDHYINELIYWHCFRYWDGWWTMAPHAKGKTLEYGGGLGTMSAMLCRDGQAGPVHYYDINRKMVDFVRFRIQKHGMPIHVIEPGEGPDYHLAIEEDYDTIVAIDIIEHIPNWKEATDHLLSRLRPGGVLIQHTNFGRSETHPMHFDSDVSMSDFLKSRGMRQVLNRYREYDGIVWQK